MDRAGTYDCFGDSDRVHELLGRVERGDDAEAWNELGHRLLLECATVFPASFAALPRLVPLASHSARARELAGLIVMCVPSSHDCDDLLPGCAVTIEVDRPRRC
ncbi:hypothetical protein [Streptomyces sp. OP7]|uniref:hypothetical protein n=1 Tax=Streptomyces sp. OP7 TaxID=3142462 RepID=UPI0032E92EE6